jgi:radical SAM protein with 4Fe4S-binding SPASM domain
MTQDGSICLKPWENLLVEVNGDCYFCCFIIRPGGMIGNLKKDDLEKIWASPKANKIRKSISQGKIPYYCQICPYFGQFKQDRSLLYRLFFLSHKAADAARDFYRGGFTRDRLKFKMKRIFFPRAQR